MIKEHKAEGEYAYKTVSLLSLFKPRCTLAFYSSATLIILSEKFMWLVIWFAWEDWEGCRGWACVKAQNFLIPKTNFEAANSNCKVPEGFLKNKKWHQVPQQVTAAKALVLHWTSFAETTQHVNLKMNHTTLILQCMRWWDWGGNERQVTELV